MSLPKFIRGLATVSLLLTSVASFAVSIVDRPLDPAGYGYTSHEGQQQMFDHFQIGAGSLVNQVSWYGQFSDGLEGNGQSVGNFNVFLFRSDPEGETISPEGVITTGTPSGTVFTARGQSSMGSATGIADPLQGGDIMKWQLDIPTLYLDPGKYWISICAAVDEPGYYLWNHSAGVVDGVDFAGTVSSSNEPRVWSSSTVPERDAMAFSLNYLSVPETGNTLVLLSSALAAIVLLRRRLG